MKASAILSQTCLALGLIILFFISCSDDDPDISPITSTKYNIPTEILNNIFTSENLKAEDILDKIKEKGMFIHEGTTPPEIYNFDGVNRVGLNFTMEHACIFDDKAATNVDSVYGKYEQVIRIAKNPDSSLVANVSYSSIGDPKYPDYPSGFDHGSGTGFATGSRNDFTVFFKAENAVFDNITYDAIWIISGTVSSFPDVEEVTNITKCMVMLEKGPDPADKVANPGTIRIFRDLNVPSNQPDVVISDVAPSSEFAETIVTINGSGFGGTPRENVVLFGEERATVQTATSTKLTVVVPPGQPVGGTVPVTIQVKNKTSNRVNFTYLQPEVIISDLDPDSAFTGSIIAINGSGFSTTTTENTVMFGEEQATVQKATTTQLTVVVPLGPAGDGTVSVTVQVKTKTSNAVNFIYPQPPVEITNLSPDNGPTGTTVTITGTGFSATEGENTVMFGQVPATVEAATLTTLTVLAPTGPQGGGVVAVTVQVKDLTSEPVNFTYPQPPVEIEGLSPDRGRTNTSVTITGSGFSTTARENIVLFGERQATVQTASTTSLTVLAPTGPQGGGVVAVIVKVKNLTSKPVNFTYLQPPVKIESLSPNSAPAKTIVTIAGSGFSDTKTENIVMFGQAQAFVRTASTSSLTVEVPTRPQGGGVVAVSVKVKDLTSNSIDFTYPQPEVIITGLTPDNGRAGDIITIAGSGFSTNTTANLNVVRFGQQPAMVRTATATALTVVVPAGSGTVPVSVQVPSSISNQINFTYLPPVVIKDFSPKEGLCNHQVTITGSGFSTNATENVVRFGQVQATVLKASFDALLVQVPQGLGEQGRFTISVQVNNSIAKTVELYSYLGCQSEVFIKDFSPKEGFCFTEVTITGTGFSAAASENVVRFGQVQAEVRKAAPTQLTVLVPINAEDGPITVQVGDKIATSVEKFDYITCVR